VTWDETTTHASWHSDRKAPWRAGAGRRGAVGPWQIGRDAR